MLISLALSLITGLSGCGFHLRSYDAKTYYNTLALTNIENSEVAKHLVAAIQAQSLPKIVTDPDSAELKLRWVSEEREKNAASFSVGGQTLSYALILRIKLVLEESQRPVRPLTIQASRLIQLNSSNPYARQEQEANAWRAIENDSITQILQRLRRPSQLGTEISNAIANPASSSDPPCPSSEPCQPQPSTPLR